MTRPDALPDELAGRLDRYVWPDGAPMALFEAMAHSPQAFRDLTTATTCCLTGEIDVRKRELLILRVLVQAGAQAEVALHIALFSKAAAITAMEAELLADPAADLEGYPPEERVLLALADEVHGSHDVCDETWARMVKYYPPTQCAELLMIVTQYLKIAVLNNVLRLNAVQGEDHERYRCK
ncbi:carboxymuconolactone decarboxylase family protein [Pacificibacter marinus]|uniref:carboxymuconolactone decarboxylase family protein n=1 Tax=Pacificibacter marinus TaxID=658057 RepID=UPI001C07D7AF|nr:carboxymuconolactone decarboxylase family protein [Pacificibacter marinus]MBU2867435.1 carboxymuconolactone decarboxylase family protein [Pacificibacter marinus]